MTNRNDSDPLSSFFKNADNRIQKNTTIRNVGTVVGALGGLVLGGPVVFAGKLLGSKTIVDIGVMAAEQTANTGTLLGQVAQGVVNTASGVIQQDMSKVDNGLGDLKDSAVTVGVGLKNGVVATYKNGKNVYEGIRDGDSEKAIQSAANIGKGVAASIIGFGVADALGVIPDLHHGDAAHGDIHLADTHTVGDGVGVEHPSIEHPGLIKDNHDLIQAKSHVDSHYVHSYTRGDGTHVHGYIRGGHDGYDTTKYVTQETAQNSTEAQTLSPNDFSELVELNRNKG